MSQEDDNFGAALHSAVRPSLAALIDLRAQAELLSFAAVRVKDGRGGGHLSHFRGRGMEFDEARPYQPGDDLRTIHWRVTARTGKPYTKLFREERDRPVLVWLDLRRPMMFATQGCFKAVRATQTAALIGWASLGHGDRFGGLVFDGVDHTEHRPGLGRGALLRFLYSAVNHPAWHKAQALSGQTAVSPAGERALLRLQRVARPGSLIFLLSDFRNLGTGAESALVQLARHSDLVAVMYSDPLERRLPTAGRYRVQLRGGPREFDAADPVTRNRYQHGFASRLASLKELQGQTGFYFLQCATDDNPLTVLAQRFARQGQRLRA